MTKSIKIVFLLVVKLASSLASLCRVRQDVVSLRKYINNFVHTMSTFCASILVKLLVVSVSLYGCFYVIVFGVTLHDKDKDSIILYVNINI